jgi:hypothetical protein
VGVDEPAKRRPYIPPARAGDGRGVQALAAAGTAAPIRTAPTRTILPRQRNGEPRWELRRAGSLPGRCGPGATNKRGAYSGEGRTANSAPHTPDHAMPRLGHQSAHRRSVASRPAAARSGSWPGTLRAERPELLSKTRARFRETSEDRRRRPQLDPAVPTRLVPQRRSPLRDLLVSRRGSVRAFGVGCAAS